MSSRFPRGETALAAVALLGTLGLRSLPPTLYLAPHLRPWALGVSAAWALWRLYALHRRLVRWHAWRVSPTWITTPAALVDPRGFTLGQGFPWTAREVETLERALLLDGALPLARGPRGGYPALHAVGQAQEKPVTVSWETARRHIGLMGTTGSGKSRLLEAILAQAMALDHLSVDGTVVIIDPKGDRDLLVRSAAEAQRHGKPFALFSTAMAQHSVQMNPLATATDALEVGQRLQALMPLTKEEIFREFPLALLIRLAEAQQALHIPWTLEGLYRVSVIRRHMEALIKDYLIHLGYFRPGPLASVIEEYDKQGGNNLTADALIEDAKWPAEHYRKITASLVPTFRGVVGGRVGPLLSPPPDTGLDWHTITQHGMVVYFALASMLIGDVANRLGRVFLQDLVGYLGRRYAYEDPATMRPITIVVDELGDVVYPEFINALNKARGANARFVVAMQSLADPEAALGQAHARRIFDNLGTRLWCGLADEQTAYEITRGMTCTVELPERPAVSLTHGGKGGSTGTTRTGLKAKDVPLLRPAWLTAVPIGEAFARVAGIWWKLRLPLLEPVSQTDREELGFTALWKALDRTMVSQGELVCDTPHLLPGPAPLLLPSPAATPRAGKWNRTHSWTFSRALRRVRRFVSAMGRRPAQP